MDGIIQCSRYAFGPNRFHYCGPDANQEIFEYIKNNKVDAGLKILLKQFNALYPYLNLIAKENHIKDCFNKKVVEAYWIGNELLDNVEKKAIYRHLLEEKKIKQKIKNKSFDELADKIKQGALPHHSFHVFDVWRRTGTENFNNEKTIKHLDSCRISWGKVIETNGFSITINTQELQYIKSKFVLTENIKKKVNRTFEANYEIEELKKNDLVSVHWEIVCEKISKKQMENLKKYTIKHLKLANQTL